MTTNRRKPKRLVWALLLLAILGGWFVLRGIQGDGGTSSLEGGESVAESRGEASLLQGHAPGLATRVPRPKGVQAGAPEAGAEPDTSRRVKIEGVFRNADSGEPVDAGDCVLRWSPRLQQGRLRRPFDIALRTDALGRFHTEISLARAGTPAATVGDIWTKDRRWRCQTFYPEGGKAGDPVTLSPGTTGRIVVELVPTLSLKGVVVDAQGHSLSGVRIKYELSPLNWRSNWNRITATTGTDGMFAVRDILARPQAVLDKQDVGRAGLIHFRCRGFMPLSLNALAVREADRLNWRVVLSHGLSIEGVLLDDTSRPLGGVKVEAVYGEQSKRRRAMTDTAGRFTIETLSKGRLTLRAVVQDQDLEARKELTLADPIQGLVLFADRVERFEPGGPVIVMGVRLADASVETRKKHGLPEHAKVVVVDPGDHLRSAGLGALPAGSGICKIEDESVRSVKHMLERIVAKFDTGRKGDTAFATVRIVYIYSRESKNAGSSDTLHVLLHATDVDSLKGTLRSLR